LFIENLTKRFVLIGALGCALIATYAIAQPATKPNAETVAAPAKVTLAGKWKKGDQRTFIFEKRKVRNTATVEPSARYEVLVTVMEASDQSYLLKLNLLDGMEVSAEAALPGDTDGSRTKALKEEVLKLVPREFIVKTDEYGSVETLENWETLGRQATLFIEKTAAMAGERVDQKALASAKKLYESEPAARQTMLADFNVLFVALGDELEPGKVLEIEGDVPSPLLGPLKTRQTMVIYANRPAAGSYLRKLTSSVDQEAFATAMAAYLKKFAPDDKQKAAMNQMGLAVADEVEIELEMKTGWLIRALQIRKIGPPGKPPIETITLRVEQKK
jgi:hypothetical protein